VVASLEAAQASLDSGGVSTRLATVESCW